MMKSLTKPNRFQFGEQLRLRTIPNRDSKALLMYTDSGQAIFTVSFDGERLHQITPFYNRIFRMAWSADGEWLVYVATDELVSTHDRQAASSVIYRQQFDGSERTELWHLDDTMSLLNLENIEDDTFGVSFARIGSSDADLPIYRITTTEDGPTPITPADRLFTFYDYPMIEDWVVVYDYDIGGGSNQVYRMKANGEDFAPLLTLDVDVDRVIPYIAISSDELLIVVVQHNTNLMYRVNLETLEHERIIPDYDFNVTRSTFLSRDEQYLLLTATIGANRGYFRYNIRENSYELLAFRSNLNGSSQWIAHVFETTALDIEVFGNTQNNRTEVYLFDQITGDHQLLTSFATSATPIFTDLPTDGEEVIMSITETFTLGGTTRQARINGVTGAMTPVNFGINMRFSPFIDSDWNGIALVVVGGGLLALLFGWRIIESRYDDAKTLRTEVLRYK